MRKFGWMTVLVMVMGCAAVAFAAEQAASGGAPAATAAKVDFMGMLKGGILGAIVGAAVALLGYLKDEDPTKSFDRKKAVPTVLVGLFLGIFSGWDGLDLTKWTEWKNSLATVLTGELLLKVTWRNGAPAVAGAVTKYMKKEPAK